MTRIVLAVACFLLPRLAAQDGPTSREFCDARQCFCTCTEDVLALQFAPHGASVIEGEPGQRLEATVVLETKSTDIQGWFYTVQHDALALTVVSATTDGTDADRLFQRGFNATRFEGIVECTSGPDPECTRPAAGLVSIVVLSIIPIVVLPVGTNSLARVTYLLEPAALEPPAHASLEFKEELSIRGSQPVGIGFAITNGRTAQPKTIIDGRIILSGRTFHRGDPGGDGRVSVTDAVTLLLFLFLSGPAPSCLESGDFDDDGRIDTTDPVLILRWLFLGGSAPAPPGPPSEPCGPDPAGSSLGCATYAGC